MPSFYEREKGAALSVTIDKYNYVILHENPTNTVKIMYRDVEEYPDVNAMQKSIISETLLYNKINSGITVASISDISAQGSGLGSSSAFTVGLHNALARLKGKLLLKSELASDACRIEIDRCGFPIGKQDQYAAAYGGFNLFEFLENGSVKIDSLDPVIFIGTREKLEHSLVLVHSGRDRSANEILAKQKSAMDDSVKFDLVRKSRNKAYVAIRFLMDNDVDSFGNLLHEAWQDKKSVVNTISNSYIDFVYEKAMASGALGGKLLGAGGGGFFLFFVPPNDREKFYREIQKDTDCKPYDFKFVEQGSTIQRIS